MGVEGAIAITLHRGGAVDLVSERPLAAASRLFAGRDVASVLSGVPGLFSVCGNAQGVTAARACGAAVGAPMDVATELARDILVLAETAREHLWRLLLDWPRAHGEQPDASVSTAGGMPGLFRRALFGDADPFALDARASAEGNAVLEAVGELRALVAEHVFADSPANWIRLAERDFVAWIGAGATAPARFLGWVNDRGLADLGSRAAFRPLPVIDDAALAAELDGDPGKEFVAQPIWRGECCETGPFARQAAAPGLLPLTEEHGSGLLTRLAARVLELALIPSRMLDLYQRLDAVRGRTMERPVRDYGLAQVEAVRGRLAHRVEVAGGVVVDYRILAPTEWNFHPGGVAAAGLAGLDTVDIAEREERAGLWIGAVDPCVEYRLAVE